MRPSAAWKTVRRLSPEVMVTGSAWAARLLQVVVQLASVPLLVSYLGVKQYAVVAIVQSLAAWFLLTDLGIGASVQNLLSEARAKGKESGHILASTGLLVCVLLFVFLAGLAFAAVPAQSLLLRRLVGPTLATAGPILVAAGVAYLLSALGGVAYRVFYGEQRGYWAHAYQSVGSLLTLVWILALQGGPESTRRLLPAILAVAVPPALVALIASGHAFLSKLAAPQWAVIREILKRARGFGSFSFLAAFVIHMDYVIMSQTLGAREVVEYNILNRVFMLAFFLYNSALMALWPTCAELLAKGAVAGTDRRIRRYLMLGGLLVVGTTVCVYVLKPVIAKVLAPGAGLNLPASSIVLFGAYLLVRVWSDTFGMVLQSANRIRPLLWMVAAQGVLSVSLQYELSRSIGLNGILIGLIVAFMATSVWLAPLVYGRSFVRQRTRPWGFTGE
ncbi:MAG: MATE family efflux transporter [Actinomycetota bacterium]|nr:MATE family efflux transporter [Actinomycetota bacterium]